MGGMIKNDTLQGTLVNILQHKLLISLNKTAGDAGGAEGHEGEGTV